MSRAIKVDNQDWEKLRQMQSGGETFAVAVHRLIAIKETTEQYITEMEMLPEYRKMRIDRPEMGVKKGGE